jgi:hypothetical protein
MAKVILPFGRSPCRPDNIVMAEGAIAPNITIATLARQNVEFRIRDLLSEFA